MKKISTPTFSLLFFMLMIAMNTLAQTGTIKVFSEIAGTEVYLDDVLKGTDISLIESVEAGSHYLKVTKDKIILYSELVLVKAGEETIVLIKDTPEIQEKILATKLYEQEQYRAQKLDVMLSTKYVTETTGATKTTGNAVNYFPGYYALSSKSETTSISTTFAVTDWFLVRGTTKISERTFATLCDNKPVIDAYNQKDAEIKEANLKKAKKSRAMMFIAGGVLTGLGIASLSGAQNIDRVEKPTLYGMALIAGVCFTAGGAGMIITGAVTSTEKYNVFPGVGDLNLISFDQAVQESKLYNQRLKIKLGLPESFEPQ